MKKMIKKSVQMRLDELIKYIFDNDIRDRYFFCCTEDNHIRVFDDGRVYSNYAFSKSDTFTVEVEEEITNDTRFKGVQEIYINDEGLLEVEYHPILARKSINDVLEEHEEETECLYIYAAVDGKTELIWEVE